jgi:hypothetical protein
MLSDWRPAAVLAVLVVYFKHLFLAGIPLLSTPVVKWAFSVDCSRSTEMETVSYL